MKNRPSTAFKYNFRAPGSDIEGPIRFAIGKTVREMILVGKSPQGICAIFLDDSEDALRRQLEAEFPKVKLEADQIGLHRELRQVIAFIDKDIAEGVIDLDIGGTPFQQQVWQALCGIPAGQTRSYGDVARDLGVPEAVRAVASACAANVLAIAIPCHRVVRRDGALSGYRWGVDRKRALLAEERE
ncbi:cysteine methyltransferase [Burkholderia sp. MSh2]|uniref:methylated-DNA--[protein]-cysteine S-methyltransferase n=1 Tax=Burkholderia paludis TaxID=1506587 RepID=A0A6J5DIY7_9BURK|nr:MULTISPECIES: methylated-DNA--[protein]-cysteine S-methyltransferase [Burkholderia]KEZ04290.1 cysteine methyltransferase [Burkholderia sp. MSh2]CAB3753417.1 Bifunctional transcriptional activator/DNA repair enzyme Ada [Burkholderia paludis]VWB67330.1 methylated-DNA--protein-cysteine methyltransferase [Burkholderia paludis]